jgi:predicted nucleic acid-binding protein
MTVVFADTSFFVAFLNDRDRAHRLARDYADNHFRQAGFEMLLDR